MKTQIVLPFFPAPPVNLSILVKVLQALQHLSQDGGNAGLIQHPVLMFPTGDDMLDDVQHRA